MPRAPSATETQRKLHKERGEGSCQRHRLPPLRQTLR
jgi:hypothetical protein